MDTDAPQYGYQPDRIYLPSPQEIARQCEAIRSRWSARENYYRTIALPDARRADCLSRNESGPVWAPPTIRVTAEIAAELERL